MPLPRWFAPLAFALGLAPSACGDTLDAGNKACTDIGCNDVFSLELSRPGVGLPAGDHTMTVMAEGRTATCRFTVPAGGTTSASVDCGSQIGLVLFPRANCTEVRNGSAVSQSCTPIAGEYVVQLSVQGTPASVRVVLELGGMVLLDRSFTPAYQETRPNGPGCPPVCRQASVKLMTT